MGCKLFVLGITLKPVNLNDITLQSLLETKFSDGISVTISLGDTVVERANSGVRDFFTILKNDPSFDFNFLVDITAVDYLDTRETRFEIVYHLLSLPSKKRLRVKIPVHESSPKIESIVPVYASANFIEREVFDMYGIIFEGHPDLRRILMYDEFKGHPLRKDFPVQGKQPRVQMLHPEVRNTAVDMVRENLVSINRRDKHVN